MNNIVIGMLAHVDAGKTTLSEALLYSTGTIRTLGRVDNKNAFLDTDSMERARGITIFSKQAQLNLKTCSVTLLDTPGHVDFSAEMERTLQVLDYAILVISGADGVQGHTKTLWQLLTHYRIPTFIFVNKMDQQGTNRARLLEQLNNLLSSSVIDFSYKSAVDMEAVALCDEALLEKHLEGEDISDADIAGLIADRKLFPCFFGSALKITGVDELIKGLEDYLRFRKYPDTFGAKVYKITRDSQGNRLTHLKVTGGTLSARMPINDNEKINQIRIYSGEKFSPVNEINAGGICAVTGLESTFAGQSLGKDLEANIPMLEPVLTYQLLLPEDADPLLVLPKLRLLEEEDPQLHIVWNEFLKEIHLQVMGAVQIEVLQNIIADRFGIDVKFGAGNIVYKETIADTVEGVGHFEPLRHYAEVHLILEPGERGSGVMYKVDCDTDKLDKNWQRLILTHLYERAQIGVLTGSPLTDVVITLVGGRAHQKHTEGGDFRQATYRAVRQGLMQATSVLLEPYYNFTLEIPQANVGRAMTDLERMYASFELAQAGMQISSSDEAVDLAVIMGSVPVATFADYQSELIAYTKGLGKVSLQQGGYKPCHNPEEVIASIGYDAERDTSNPADSVFCSHGAGVIVPWYEVFEHMHVESILAERIKEISGNSEAELRDPRCSSRTVSDRFLGTEEVDAILRDTYYANSSSDSKRRKPFSKTKGDSSTTYVYKGKETVQNQGISYLLVDGYNIIFAWDELKELAKSNLDAARSKLLDILCNYQAMKKCELIVVFDAYRVQNHATEFLDYQNIHVVYTKEAETADMYIERFAHEHGRKHYVRVATSDGLEQIIIVGQGCHLVSAREFEQEVKEVEEHLRKEYLDRNL
ncbi:MAG: GTP-binding protein [Lachnospiraceae bacterium]|nr:GTP-binding protein [Lachnospiraceae bacterium]